MNSIVQDRFIKTISNNLWTIFDEVFNVKSYGNNVKELNQFLIKNSAIHIILRCETNDLKLYQTKQPKIVAVPSSFQNYNRYSFIYSFWEGSMSGPLNSNFHDTIFSILSIVNKIIKVYNIFQFCQHYNDNKQLVSHIKRFTFQWSQNDSYVFMKSNQWIQFTMVKSFSSHEINSQSGIGSESLLMNVTPNNSSITLYKKSEKDYQFIIWEGSNTPLVEKIKFTQFKLFIYLNFSDIQYHTKVLKFSSKEDFQMLWKVYNTTSLLKLSQKIQTSINPFIELKKSLSNNNHQNPILPFKNTRSTTTLIGDYKDNIQSGDSQPSVLSIINKINNLNNKVEPITKYSYNPYSSKSNESSPIIYKFKRESSSTTTSILKSDQNSPIEYNFIKTLVQSPIKYKPLIFPSKTKIEKEEKIHTSIERETIQQQEQQEQQESSPIIHVDKIVGESTPSPPISSTSSPKEYIHSKVYNVPYINFTMEIERSIHDFNEKKLNWVLIGYREKNSLGLIGKGNKGIQEMKSSLTDTQTLYGIVRCQLLDNEMENAVWKQLHCSNEIDCPISNPLRLSGGISSTTCIAPQSISNNNNNINSIPPLSPNPSSFSSYSIVNKTLLVHWFGKNTLPMDKVRRNNHLSGVTSMFKQQALVHGEYETDDITDLTNDIILQKLTSFHNNIQTKNLLVV